MAESPWQPSMLTLQVSVKSVARLPWARVLLLAQPGLESLGLHLLDMLHHPTLRDPFLISGHTQYFHTFHLNV